MISMDVMQAIKRRYSVRSYQERAVEEEKLKGIIEAARLAPSAKNLQEWRFIVVRNKAVRQRLMKAAKNQAFVAEAPIVIVCCAVTDNHVMTCGQLCYPIDVAIAIEHMALKATEEGLGTCWVGAFYADQVNEHVPVVELITIGYPAKPHPAHKDRLSLEQIVMYERWDDRTR
jgi:nitroreductase